MLLLHLVLILFIITLQTLIIIVGAFYMYERTKILMIRKRAFIMLTYSLVVIELLTKNDQFYLDTYNPLLVF